MTELFRYQREVLDRLDLMPKEAHLETKTYGELVSGRYKYPLQKIVTRDEFPPTIGDIIISAGTHGDEEAGVHALLEFMENILPEYLDSFRFHIFPCVNPIGFERRTREDGTGVDLNRAFGASNCDRPFEVSSLMKTLSDQKQRYMTSIDLHEDSPTQIVPGYPMSGTPTDFYFYECCPLHEKRIGRKILSRLEGVSTCTAAEIYDDKNEGGLISYPESCCNGVYAAGSTFDAFLLREFLDHALITETPMGWPLKKRIDTQIQFICHALDILIERKNLASGKWTSVRPSD